MKNKLYTLVESVAGYDIPSWFNPKDIMLATSKFYEGVTLPGTYDANEYCYLKHVRQIAFNEDYFSFQHEIRFSPSYMKESISKIKELLQREYPDRKFRFVTVKEVFTRIEGIYGWEIRSLLRGISLEHLLLSSPRELPTSLVFDLSKHTDIVDKINKGK